MACETGDLVRFDGHPPWYGFLNAYSVGLRNGGGSSDNVNQTALNTPWPVANAPHTFEILRQPIRVGSPVSIAEGRCVDLRWSGIGGSTLATYSTFGSAPGSSPGSIAVLFDGTGRLRQLFFNGSRVSISGAVFLLIGRSDRAGQDAAALSNGDDSLGANWQYPDSFWIAVDPLSGIAKTAECKANSTDVFDSQSFIRSEIFAGGR